MNLSIYMEQHQSIREEINIINALINKGNIAEDAGEIALHINLLAGRLNIHLSVEDKYLYPELQETGDAQLKNMVEAYKSEMGELFDEFNTYKVQFNTKPKLMAHEGIFISNTKRIFNQIISRMEKEEKGLYKQI